MYTLTNIGQANKAESYAPSWNKYSSEGRTHYEGLGNMDCLMCIIKTRSHVCMLRRGSYNARL